MSDNKPRTGRRFTAKTVGDSPEQLEEVALTQAREFFGDDVPELRVSDKYTARVFDPYMDGGYGRYAAIIDVYEVLQAEDPHSLQGVS